MNNKDWIKEVRQNINRIKVENLEDEKERKVKIQIKDILNSTIDTIQKRGRVYGHPKGTIDPICENDWLTIAKELDTIRPFYSIFATEHFYNNILIIEDLPYMNVSEKFGLKGSQHYIKNEEVLQNIFLPLLSYAKKLTVIDPYFYMDEERYETTLNFIAKYFRERRGLRDKGAIVINCKWNEKLELKLKKWKKIINRIFKEYGHIITIKLWSRKGDNELKLHERYLITESAEFL